MQLFVTPLLDELVGGNVFDDNGRRMPESMLEAALQEEEPFFPTLEALINRALRALDDPKAGLPTFRSPVIGCVEVAAQREPGGRRVIIRGMTDDQLAEMKGRALHQGLVVQLVTKRRTGHMQVTRADW